MGGGKWSMANELCAKGPLSSQINLSRQGTPPVTHHHAPPPWRTAGHVAHIDGGRAEAAHALRDVGVVLEQAHVGQPALVVLVAKPGDQQRLADVVGGADLVVEEGCQGGVGVREVGE